jgi:ethanolamine ammonia-lyase large subunit
MDIDKFKLIFARANEFKEGDLLVGGTTDEAVRKDAKDEIAAMRIGAISKLVFVEDAVTEAIFRSINSKLLNDISDMTVGEMKNMLLSPKCISWVKKYSDGLTSETIAALVKIMKNHELSTVARSIYNILPNKMRKGHLAIGSANHFGSRIQPNSPGDDEEEILISVLEGLAYGCGDVIIGLNPASDDIETIVRTEKLLQSIVERLQLPTRYCVLSDMIKQSTVRSQTKVDVGFQSLSGTSKALVGMLGLDVDGLIDLSKGFEGLYFETGQGSEVTNGAAEGVDMVTLESRCYGLARHVRGQCGDKWMIVNDVAGFIGPEVFRTGDQLMRACLEDTVMAKLHGLTFGLDVCSTFHMGIAPFELQRLTESIAKMAAPSYLMSVAGKADPMLGYLTTSYREHPRLRVAAGKQITGVMHDRLFDLGVMTAGGKATGAPEKTAILYGIYMKEGGDTRNLDELRLEGLRKIASLREKGCDIGYGAGNDLSDPPIASTRIETLYGHARNAIYSKIDSAVIRDCCPHYIKVTTNAINRDDYLAHPVSGELINAQGVASLKSLYSGHKGASRINFVISDGLNANSVNENLRNLLPKLKWSLRGCGFNLGKTDIIIENGRVRAGYHVGQLIESEVLIHLIGERPGTGLNQLSAYLTYGKEQKGNFRWSPNMDHSCTTAVCSIHLRGKTPESAIFDIVKCVKRMLELKCSGVCFSLINSNQ